jgi:CDP-ribitol ribitolphosphotransferase
LPPSSTVAAAERAADVEIVSVDWQRIQAVVRLRPSSGEALEPTSLALRHAETGRLMPATGGARDGVDTVVRFNVMQGPGQVPLDPGTWRLVAAGGAGEMTQLSASVAPTVVLAERGRSFALRRGLFGAVPGLDDREFALHVSLDRRSAEPWDEPLRRFRSALVRRAGRASFFRLLLAFVRGITPRNGRRILFASDSRANLGGNLQIVYDRMIELGLAESYELSTLFKASVRLRRSLTDRFRLVWRFARADVIVIDDYHPVIYRIDDPDTRIIQLWHAVGAFKTVGYSRVGKPGAPDPWSSVHKNYTHAIVSSEHDVPFYAEAFGIPESRVVPTGIPRVDRFFDPAFRAAALGAALSAWPEARDRMTILFAPTFRGHGARTARYDQGRIDYAALHAVCVERDAVCIVRMHPFVRQQPAIPAPFRDRILDGSSGNLDINAILPAVDLLITDYSSVVFEFSTLGRPMLFYAWDLEEYVGSRDFYVQYEDFVPGRIVRTFDELVAAIRAGDYEAHKVAPFAARHFDHLDGGSTDRVVDLILSS